MRDSIRFFHPRAVLLMAALVLTACGGGGARSPDLPFPELLSFGVSCAPNPDPLEIGQQSQCTVTAGSCQYREVLANGSSRVVSRDCPAVSWSSESPSVATIDDTGLITGVAAGSTTVTGSIDGITQTVPVRVVTATLVGANASCTPNALLTDQTSQCTVSNCTYTIPGIAQPVTRQCPDATWTASPATVGTITNAGVFTAVGAGTATITANVGSLRPTTQIQVTAACIDSLVIEPANATVVAGLPRNYTARALSNNGLFATVTQQTTFRSSNNNVASFPTTGAGNSTASTNAQLEAQTNVTVTGSVSSGTCSGNPVEGSTTLTVQPSQIRADDGLCLEQVAADGFDGCRADTGACKTTALSLATNQTQQVRLRARFESGLECNLTDFAASSITSSVTTVATVSNTAPGRGVVTGVSAGTSTLTGTTTFRNVERTAPPMPVTVRLTEKLGANSVSVSAKSLANPGQPSKFACVGATDLVGGLSDSSKLQGQQRLFAGARFCDPANVDADDNCTSFIDGDVFRDVTNDDGATTTNPDSNRIEWKQSNGYWNGEACVTTLPALPIGNGASALVGDDQTSAANYSAGIRAPGENGVVVGAGNLRLGFSCITAEYSNPLQASNKDLDGMTILVLPVTNDVLLGSSNDTDATQLCEALEPLFQLGASENGGNGVVTQVLSVVTEIVNPILQSLASGQEPGNTAPLPIDDLVNQLLGLLADPLTEQLFATPLGDLVALLDNTVYAPVICGLDSLLTALLTANPAALAGAQACVPEIPTFPFPVAAP